MAKSKEGNRLSLAIGLLSSFAVFCWGFWEMFMKRSPEGENEIVPWVAIVFTCSITFFVSWSFTRLLYLVYFRFKEDKESKN